MRNEVRLSNAYVINIMEQNLGTTEIHCNSLQSVARGKLDKIEW